MTEITTTNWVVLEHTEDAVSEFVTRILKLTSEPSPPLVERRRNKRTTYARLLTLTPLHDNVLQVAGECVTVVGKHLAPGGLDFYHVDPLPFKRVIVSFDESLALDKHFVLDIGWCRFLRSGWYDSGGRFTHIVTPEDFEKD